MGGAKGGHARCFLVTTDATVIGFFSSSLFSFSQATITDSVTTTAAAIRTTAVAIRTTAAVAATDSNNI